MYIPKLPPFEDDPYATIRNDTRHSVLRSAELILPGQDYHPECVVRDISKTGMRILVDNPERLPDEFIVVLKQSAKQFNCLVKWRTEHEIGVQVI